jgi:hypothetical protein
MALLSRSDILRATATPQEMVSLTKELGGDVLVRGMTGVERDAFEASCLEGRGKRRDFNMKNFRAKMVAACCIDDQGHRIFTDADVIALGEVRADVIDKLFSVAQRLSGMRDEDVDELGLGSEKTAVSAMPSSPSPSG